MPIYKVEVVKRVATQKWRNTWYVYAENLAGTTVDVQSIISFEAAIHLPIVYLTHALVSNPEIGSTSQVSVPINRFGESSLTGDFLKPENVVRLDLGTNSYMGSKLYRYALTEGSVAGYTIGEAALSIINAACAEWLQSAIDGGNLRTASGLVLVFCAVSAYVENRQLHNKRKPVAT